MRGNPEPAGSSACSNPEPARATPPDMARIENWRHGETFIHQVRELPPAARIHVLNAWRPALGEDVWAAETALARADTSPGQSSCSANPGDPGGLDRHGSEPPRHAPPHEQQGLVASRRRFFETRRPTTGAGSNGSDPPDTRPRAGGPGEGETGDAWTPQRLETHVAWTHSTVREFHALYNRRPPSYPQPFVDRRLWLDYRAAEVYEPCDPHSDDAQAGHAPACSACGEPIHGVAFGTSGRPLHFGCWQAELDATTT